MKEVSECLVRLLTRLLIIVQTEYLLRLFSNKQRERRRVFGALKNNTSAAATIHHRFLGSSQQKTVWQKIEQSILNHL